MRIILVRHGESEYNPLNIIGGDPNLSEKGTKFASNLNNFIENQSNWFPKKCICSSKKRVQQTVDAFKSKMNSILINENLNELNAGRCEELTYTQFYQMYPDEFAKRYQDKLNYRYPGGESYIDLIERVRPVVEDIKNKGEDVFIVCHQAVNRALIAHFTDEKLEDIPHVDVPLHNLVIIEDGKKKGIITVGDIINDNLIQEFFELNK
jgi:broad specificity phosphatase PhoE